MCRSAKFCANRSNRSGDMAILDFLRRMVAIRHLDLLYACLDHPRRVFGGLYDCANFGWNQHCNFDSMQVLTFCTLSLKMSIHAP